MIIGQK